MVKYDARVTAVGPLATVFFEHGIIVFFGSQAPEELRRYSVIHDGQTLRAPVTVGDQVMVGECLMRILAVGEAVNDNLHQLGHLTLKLNGESEPELPGDVCVAKWQLPPINIGTIVRIYTADERAK